MDKSKDIDKISSQEMTDAIERSGYLLEQRIEPVFAEFFYTETNRMFFDKDTGKNQELDLIALSSPTMFNDKDMYHIFQSTVLVECENNPQPVVFFSREVERDGSLARDFKFSGNPIKLKDRKGHWEQLSSVIKMYEFHHYALENYSKQYCSFQKKKDKQGAWFATHNEEQHNTFSKLIKAVKAQTDEHYDYLSRVFLRPEARVSINNYYPVLVLQGDLYKAHLVKNKLVTEKIDHILYAKEHVEQDRTETYLIDVVTEAYLPKYLKTISNEMYTMLTRLEKKKKKLLETESYLKKTALMNATIPLKDILEYNYNNQISGHLSTL